MRARLLTGRAWEKAVILLVNPTSLFQILKIDRTRFVYRGLMKANVFELAWAIRLAPHLLKTYAERQDKEELDHGSR